MSSRDVVLSRIRRALSDAPPATSEEADGHPAVAVAAPLAADLDLFCERVRDYKAEVVRVSADQVPVVVATLLSGSGSTVVPAGVPHDYLSQVPPQIVVRRDEPTLSHAELDATAAVLTTCAAAISVSGTVILDAGPGQGRRALSLLPDFHVVVVRADQVVDEIGHALARLDPQKPQTWISGPSATSDIELSRVEGVHGPRRLAVVLVEPGNRGVEDGSLDR
jgi:L-lactate dehydrogenase complex protein LldG